MLMGAGTAVVGDRWLASNAMSPPQETTSQLPIAPESASGSSSRLLAAVNSNFIAAAVQKVGPAVVRIDATRTVRTQVPEAFNDPFFRRFFGRNVPIPRANRIEEGTGSGVVIDANGVILTNAHVVDRADRVTVYLRDGRSFEGRVLGTDTLTDIAVIQVEANDLPVAELGDSDQLMPGEWAIAIGNPLGLDNTVTAGIISATDRSSAQVGVPDRRVGFIQTDAAINPGNSGGPLLNDAGQVMGINTAIIGGAQGLGFAIPINTAKRIAAQLVANGEVKHPYLGIQMATLTPALKDTINNDPNSGLTVQEDEGVLVVQVMPNSPAEKAGIQKGDVIQQLNEQPVADAAAVQQLVEGSEIGSELPVELRRNGETVNLTVKPDVLPLRS